MKIISHPANDNQLIKKAINQNRKAQKQLFDKYASPMLAVCRRYIKDLHFAEDTMIKGFTKAYNALDTFDQGKDFKIWLRQIMVNESISFLRSKHGRQFDFDNEDTIEPFDFQSDFNVMDNIQQAIDQLPSGYKTIFLLHVIEGYKHEEIAAKLNISVGTSKSQLSRARDMLRTLLNEYNTTNYEQQRF